MCVVGYLFRAANVLFRAPSLSAASTLLALAKLCGKAVSVLHVKEGSASERLVACSHSLTD